MVFRSIVESRTDPRQRWANRYSHEGAAGTDLSRLGLTDDEAPVARGYILSVRRKLKEEATVNPEELLDRGFWRSSIAIPQGDPSRILAGEGRRL